MEPSRCKTTSTVTFSLEIQASTSILFQSIREHNIQNTVDLQKKQNPNIQPYKIIQQVSLLWALRLAETQQSVCTMIFTLTFTGFIFAKLKQFIIVDGPQSLATNPAAEVFSIQLVQSD